VYCLVDPWPGHSHIFSHTSLFYIQLSFQQRLAVYNDLRILEEQQKESDKLLQEKRQVKKQRLDSLSSLENKLQGLQYCNGQERARLQRMSHLLGQGQRNMHASKTDADNIKAGLKQVNDKVRTALERKRNIQATEQRESIMEATLQEQVAYLERATEQKDAMLAQIAAKVEELERAKAALAEAIKQGIAKKQGA
jgi:chromosome segregation ATPase